MNHPDWESEQNRLQMVLNILKTQLKSKLNEKDYLVNQQADINQGMWEDAGYIQDLESISDFMQHINMLKQNMSWSRMTAQDIKRLDKQLASPYFGRLDFIESSSSSPDKIYIGIHTLTDDDTSEILIYDWRAPVCSMFYDYEPGPAGYKAPVGNIKGEILLKRQYRIIGGKLILMFDSSLAINDDILQEILASQTSGKMRSIVSTIQKEQNSVIRNDSTPVLAIQGAAGSGKTSVALHRASYLLYRHKKTIRTENLIILATTDVLGDYISDVLPELGEEAIKGITFTGVMKRYLKKDIRLETHPGMLEKLLTCMDTESCSLYEASLKFKSSLAFIDHLNRYYQYALEYAFHFEAICFKGKQIISGEKLGELFYKDFSAMTPLARLKRIENRISDQIKPLKKAELDKRAQEIEEQDISLSIKEAKVLSQFEIKGDTRSTYEELQKLLSLSACDLYTRLFEDINAWNQCVAPFSTLEPQVLESIRVQTLKNLKIGFYKFEDTGAILYLSLLLGETEPDASVRHMIVDEAQDYSPTQMLALKKLFPTAGITLLGDMNQHVSPYSAQESLETTANFISPGNYEFVRLEKSYRSTIEISTFACAAASVELGAFFGRHGEKPLIHLIADQSKYSKALAEAVEKGIQSGAKTTAIITRTSEEAYQLYHSISKLMKQLPAPFRLMREEYEYALEGIMVIPSYLAKGLEFDDVYVTFGAPDDYIRAEEQGLLYTVLCRALHHLSIFCPFETLPQVLNEVDPLLFEVML